MKISTPMKAPVNWQETWNNIRKVRQLYPAPVDSMGCDQAHNRKDKDTDQRFQILLSLMLSSQTKDPVTWAAVQRLKDRGWGNVSGILGATERDLEETIIPVGFYRRKAIYLKKVAQILSEKYNNDIPNTVDELCKLPGVGPKMAHLCMLEAWNEVSGIGVDTHVHRIAARLNWVPSTGVKNPEDTRKALESWLPQEYWSQINHLLVGFGQTICTPIGPKCSDCFNNSICPSANLKKEPKKEPKSSQGKVKVNAKKAKPSVDDSQSSLKKVKLEKTDDKLEEQKGETTTTTTTKTKTTTSKKMGNKKPAKTVVMVKQEKDDKSASRFSTRLRQANR